MTKPSRVDELMVEVVRLKKMGVGYKEAAKQVGLSPTTVYRHLDEEFPELLHSPMNKPAPSESLDAISERWWDEFRGIFFGEGCVRFSKATAHNSRSLRRLTPELRIHMRIDEEILIKDIRAHIGGYVVYRSSRRVNNKGSHAQVCWCLVGYGDVYFVCQHLSEASLPARKLSQVKLMIEACEARFLMSSQLSQEERQILWEFDRKISDMKLLKS